MTLLETWNKAKTHVVKPMEPGHFIVISSTSNVMYDVFLRGTDIRQCNCDHGHNRQFPCCSHILAAARLAASSRGYAIDKIVRQEEEPTGPHFVINPDTFLIVRPI